MGTQKRWGVGKRRRSQTRGKMFALDPFSMDERRKAAYLRDQGPDVGRQSKNPQGSPYTRNGQVKKNFRNLEYDEVREDKLEKKRLLKIQRILDLSPKPKRPKLAPEKKETAVSKIKHIEGEHFSAFKRRVNEAMREDRLKILTPKSTHKKRWYKKKALRKKEKLLLKKTEQQRDLEDAPKLEIIEFGETVHGPPTLPRAVKRKFRQADMLPKTKKKKQRFKNLTFSKKIEVRAVEIKREKAIANYKKAKAEKFANRNISTES